MGMLALQRIMSQRRDRRRRHRQARARNGTIDFVDKRKGSPCQQDGNDESQASKIIRYSIPDLPQDVWRHIHSLMPLRDAACSACLSRAFLQSWRQRPNLTLNKDTLRSKAHAHGGKFSDRIDCIMRNHSGIGVKILRLQLYGIAYHNLDSWLKVAVTPGIEELQLSLGRFKIKYNFPCSLLSDGIRNSIRYLDLGFCAFHPTTELGPLRSLTTICLHYVHITGVELECLLSNSLALEQLELNNCKEIICLKIPCVLQKFGCLSILGCWRLQVIESKAPNLSSLYFCGNVKLSLGDTLQLKNLSMSHSNIVYYARAELPSIMPNIETLELRSDDEVVNTPMLPTKFIYLKHLTISIRSGVTFSPSYDYFSLFSFIDASPSLETLILDVSQEHMEHESVFRGPSCLRLMPEHHHGYLKSVKISGFSSAKSLIELTCRILVNAVSLECLTLDTLYGFRCSDKNITTCYPMSKSFLREAARALVAIRTYIEDKVPATVKFTVVEPCSQCHAKGVRW